MKVYLVTTGDGSDGCEWKLLSIHKTREGAEAEKDRYESPKPRKDGSTYHLDADIEEWPLND